MYSNERSPLRWISSWCNRYLSGIGLTGETWYCAGGWLSRLDMNTCQTGITTSILLMYLSNTHPGYQRNETPQWFLYRTKHRGIVKRTNRPPKYVSYRNYGNYQSILLVRRLTNLSAFRNRVLSSPDTFNIPTLYQ